jgi:hypothetical protein
MIGRSGTLKRVAAWTAAACAAGVLVVAQQAPAAAATCDDVYFVSARGSGETYTVDLAGSPEIQAVEAGMTATLRACLRSLGGAAVSRRPSSAKE